MGAAIIEVSGGTPADFTVYTERDLLGAPDPWPYSGAVTDATLTIASRMRIDVIYRGESDDAWEVIFGDSRSFDSGSAAGDEIRGLSPSDFLALFFSNEATGVPLTDPSVAVQAFGNILEIGWNGTSFENDFGYRRLQATVTPIPLPAGLPLLATALAAFGAVAWRRSRAGSGGAYSAA